jgi:tRNA-binding protein
VTIEYADFEKVHMHVGEIVEVHDFPEARAPSYRLRIDFGKPLGEKQSVAAIKHHYEASELVGRQIVAVTNFPAKQIGHHLSEVLVLAAVVAEDRLRLLQPDSPVELGSRIR